MAETAQAVEEKPDQQTDSPPGDAKQQAQSVEFSEATETEVAGGGGSIDILLDMKVPVAIILGQTEVPVQRFLRLGPGSVLKLDKSIEEPVDLYLKDAKFATGSVVVVDGRFAVKIKQIFGLGDSANVPNEATA